MKRRSKVSSKPAKAQGRNAAKPKRRTTRHEPTVAPAAGERGESPGTIRELNEAREQLQAISEVLRALGSSQGQLEPIFQSMLKNATRLCEAKFGALYLRETGGLRVSVMHGAPPAFVEERRRNPVIQPRPGTMLADALATMRAVPIADLKRANAVPPSPLKPSSPSRTRGCSTNFDSEPATSPSARAADCYVGRAPGYLKLSRRP